MGKLGKTTPDPLASPQDDRARKRPKREDDCRHLSYQLSNTQLCLVKTLLFECACDKSHTLGEKNMV